VLYRTQLFDPGDIENVKKIQAGYKVQPLSSFLGTLAAPPAAKVDFIKPLTVDEERSSIRFFDVLNFLLQFAPTDPSETELRARLAKLGIGTGKDFDTAKLPPETQQALREGMTDAWKEFAAYKASEIDTDKRTSADFFGTRAYLKNDYMARM